MFRQLNIPVLGVVENMSLLRLPALRGAHRHLRPRRRRAAWRRTWAIPFLGEVPIDTRVRSGGDEGQPIVAAGPRVAGGPGVRRRRGQGRGPDLDPEHAGAEGDPDGLTQWGARGAISPPTSSVQSVLTSVSFAVRRPLHPVFWTRTLRGFRASHPCGLVSPLLIALVASGGAQTPTTTLARPEIAPVRVSAPPVIDGVLDDEAWRERQRCRSREWLTYNPLNGDTHPPADRGPRRLRRPLPLLRLPLRGPRARQGAQHPQPARQHVERRLGRAEPRLGRQRPELVRPVREPAGVQGDILTTPSAGENSAPDFVWDSAGRRTEPGLRRRDAAAPHQRPLQERDRRQDGRAVLAAGQPAGHVGVLARGPRGAELHRAPRDDGAARPEAAADARADPERDLLARGRRARRPTASARPTPTPTPACR